MQSSPSPSAVQSTQFPDRSWTNAGPSRETSFLSVNCQSRSTTLAASTTSARCAPSPLTHLPYSCPFVPFDGTTLPSDPPSWPFVDPPPPPESMKLHRSPRVHQCTTALPLKTWLIGHSFTCPSRGV